MTSRAQSEFVDIRSRQFRRFATERSRNWGLINLAELARWVAEQRFGLLPGEDAIASAFQLVWEDFKAGIFHEQGRSMLLFMNRGTGPRRLTEDGVERYLHETHGDVRIELRNFLLASSWCLPQSVARFFAAHDRQLPRRFDDHFANRRRIQARYAHRIDGRGRGRAADVFESVVAAMERELRSGRMTLSQLVAIKQQGLPNLYPGSRTTCVRARRHILSTWQGLIGQLPTKDK